MVLLFNGHTALDSMIESGERNKERFQGELFAVYVCQLGRSKRERVTIRKYFDAAKKARCLDRSAGKRRSGIGDSGLCASETHYADFHRAQRPQLLAGPYLL